MKARPENGPEGQTPALRLLVFGFDATEPSQIRRIRSYLNCGFDVLAFTMRRENADASIQPFWENVHLANTRHEAMGQRLRAILSSLPKLWRNRKRMQGADVIVARNLDMLAVAAVARTLIRPQPALIYECLDIHNLMTGQGPKSRLARFLERRLLARCTSLIVSSPAFVREYFAPVQAWTGPVSLVENKIWVGNGGPGRPKQSAVRDPDESRPVRLGWVGSLRCPRSLSILAESAERLGPRVEIRMHGIVHRHAVPEFDAVLAAHSNITYVGPYDYPDGLEAVYADCDVVWAQDLWQWSTNSKWLLPNRIYEAGYFGCPCIAVAGSETGRRVADGLGWTIPKPSAAGLVDLISGLSRHEMAEKRRSLLGMPDTMFRQDAGEIRDAIQSHLPQRS